MKKLKAIRNISFTILILFVLYIGIIGLNILFDDKTYPTAHYGLTRTDEFFLTVFFALVYVGIPLLIDFIVFIVSIIKIHNLKKQGKNI